MSARSVLNTRPREQAAELSRLLREAGFEVVEAPAIAIVPAWDGAELESVRAELISGAFDWIVLSSPNAGRELLAELHGVQNRVVCGTSTARALGLQGVALALSRFSAAGALDVLRAHLHPGLRVLLPRAAEGRNELLEGLHALGVSVDAPVAYRTVLVADAATRLDADAIHAVTLCSPSAVRSVARSVSPEVLVVCVGETTAAAARACGLRVDGVARQTSMASLVEAVSEAMGARA